MSTSDPDADNDLTRIRPIARGPLVVEGVFRLVDVEGKELAEGRTKVRLCRCGASRSAPLCDGSHNRTGFRAETDPPG